MKTKCDFHADLEQRRKAFRSIFVQFNMENVDQIALEVFVLLLLLVKHCLRDNNNKFYDFDC